MPLSPRSALLLPVLILLAAPPDARADGTPGGPVPTCGPAREGVAACLAGKACVCRFERGGSMTGRPDRFAWDCGALRPACGPAPADLAPSAGGMGLPTPPQDMEPMGDGLGRGRWR